MKMGRKQIRKERRTVDNGQFLTWVERETDRKKSYKRKIECKDRTLRMVNFFQEGEGGKKRNEIFQSILLI